ncbi:hypothetical protein ACU686_29700 [Yinghuangia aomiensis]
MDAAASGHSDESARLLREWVGEASPVWERSHDHDEFRRFMHARGWTAIQTIAVIRAVHGGTLHEAVDRYNSYWRQNQTESAAP